MNAYNEEFVTIQGEMLRQIRNAIMKLSKYENDDLPVDVQNSIKVLTGAFGYRLGVESHRSTQ